MTTTSIGILGQGKILLSIACHLRAANYDVIVLSPPRPNGAKSLTALDFEEVTSLPDLVRRADIILTHAADPSEIHALTDDVGNALKPDQLWIETSPTDSTFAHQNAANIEHRGGIYADAPFIGDEQAARRGNLASLIGCRREMFNRIKSVVCCYSGLVQRFGEAGSGQTARLLNDFVTKTTSLIVLEAFERAQQTNINRRALYDVLCHGPAHSEVLDRIIGTRLDGLPSSCDQSIRATASSLSAYRELSKKVGAQSTELADAAQAILKNAVETGHGNQTLSTLLNDDKAPWRQAG